MAGTSSCKYCVNNHRAGNDYDYSKWFHVEVPDYSTKQLDYYTSKLLEDIPKVKKSARDLSSKDCKPCHMTNKEAIELIKIASAQIEWEYPLDFQVAFKKAISALEYCDEIERVCGEE